MPRLVLIDGSSYLYRAFHALPPLSNADGEPTGALFGVVNMLRATLNEQPDCAAFVVDAPGPTFPNAMYTDYKANRPPMPDELRAQVQPMSEIVQALGFPMSLIDAVEARHLLAQPAMRAPAPRRQATIPSRRTASRRARRPWTHRRCGAPSRTHSGSRPPHTASASPLHPRAERSII